MCAKLTKLSLLFVYLFVMWTNIFFHECGQFFVEITNHELSRIVLFDSV